MLNHGQPSTFRLSALIHAFGPSPFNAANPDFRPELEQAMYAFIDLRLEQLTHTKFIDVGCGLGAVMSRLLNRYQANPLLKIEGIDLVPEFLERASKFGTTHCCDAMTFPNFTDYELIFLYRPLVERAAQAKLEDMILDQALPGSMIISVKPAAIRLISSPQYGIFEKQ